MNGSLPRPGDPFPQAEGGPVDLTRYDKVMAVVDLPDGLRRVVEVDVAGRRFIDVGEFVGKAIEQTPDDPIAPEEAFQDAS
jgi:hypothetical protein